VESLLFLVGGGQDDKDCLESNTPEFKEEQEKSRKKWEAERA